MSDESTDADVILPGAEFRRMRDEIARLDAEVERCHERLEMTHRYRYDEATDELVPVPVPRAERRLGRDGIDARDATIKGLDEVADDLRAERDAALAENAKLREALLDGIEAVTAVQLANGSVALRLIGWRAAARALVEPPR